MYFNRNVGAIVDVDLVPSNIVKRTALSVYLVGENHSDAEEATSLTRQLSLWPAQKE